MVIVDKYVWSQSWFNFSQPRKDIVLDRCLREAHRCASSKLQLKTFPRRKAEIEFKFHWMFPTFCQHQSLFRMRIMLTGISNFSIKVINFLARAGRCSTTKIAVINRRCVFVVLFQFSFYSSHSHLRMLDEINLCRKTTKIISDVLCEGVLIFSKKKPPHFLTIKIIKVRLKYINQPL